jgi:hypothetical protein
LLAVSLALVVPVQATAALTAGLCMSMGHHEGAADDSDHSMHSHADGHEGSPADRATDAGNEAHCGPCAACCASASIAGAPALAIGAAPGHPAYVFSPYPPLGVQPDGLDRPPLAL